VRAGLDALRAQGAGDEDWVLVHDAARCLLRAAWVSALIEPAARTRWAGCWRCRWPTRSSAVAARVGTLPSATEWAGADAADVSPRPAARLRWTRRGRPALPEVTDEASAMEALGLQPAAGARALENFKLTLPEDFALAEALLRNRP
jgi:2-C-methyl-D-erythritol 4-phosphate cytidylyltransferase